MDIIDDCVLRFNQIQQFPQIKLTHDENDSNCSICIGDFNKNEIILILPCVHKFHSNCIKTWLTDNNTCPTCRERVIKNVGIENDTLDMTSYAEIIDLSDHSGDLSSVFNSSVSSQEISISSLSSADEQNSISSDGTMDLDYSDIQLASTESVYSNSAASDIGSQSSDSSSMLSDTVLDNSIQSIDTTNISFANDSSESNNTNTTFNLLSSDGSDSSFDDVNDTFSDDNSD